MATMLTTKRRLCNNSGIREFWRRRMVDSIVGTNRSPKQLQQMRHYSARSSKKKMLQNDSITAAAVLGAAAVFTSCAFATDSLHLNAMAITDMEASASAKQHKQEEKNPPTKTFECDFVIVGYGNAGRSALRTLTSLNPKLKILVIDPRINVNYKSNNDRVMYVPFSRASALHHPTKTLYCTTLSSNDGDAREEVVKIKYAHSILISTGSRGSPPPMDLVDKTALSRVLELRGTAAGSIVTEHDQRITLSPEMVRNITFMAASDPNSNVCILGSGLEALELACAANNSSNRRKNGNGNNNGKIKKNSSSSNVSLLFGNAGPLSDRVPRYLSSAITKRLKLFGIDVRERSLVRYVSSDDNQKKNGDVGGLEIHASKSYDSLDTCRLEADLLIGMYVRM
uniref:FAD/NAD(P)-binding domain-containing protein n=1 Tax=Ditylum brightwellii TaxID=49249 RepID=A0A7S4UU18_9STRA|mmetsp:Transcript_46962/g.70968  ORF Transcript_46962/g.70968 Transcript_46962/m.70968 type:complete len:397 (+) Transcript_46962:303-1493(+)